MNDILEKSENKLHSYPILSVREENSEYTFFEVYDKKLTVRKNVMKKASRENEKWVKFLLEDRLTLTVSTPTYLGFPVINAYLFSAMKKGQRKKLTNVSNTLPLKAQKFSSKEFSYFIYELENLMERNNVSLPKQQVLESLKRLYASTFRGGHNALYNSWYKEILSFYLHPLLMHVESPDDDIIKELPCSTARTFDDLVSVLKVETEPLKKWLKEKYEKNILKASHLFLLTICKSWKETELLEVLKLVDFLFAKLDVSQRYLFDKDHYRNHSSLAGLMPKVTSSMMVDVISDFGAEIIKKRYARRIELPREEVLRYWSKNYRKTKPVKKKLEGLTDKDVLNYLSSNIEGFGSNSPKDEENMIRRINTLKLVTKPVTVLEVPKIYKNLLNVISRKDNDVLITSAFLKKDYFLHNSMKHVGNSIARSNEIVCSVNVWENAISLMEQVDAYIVSMFTRKKVTFDPAIAVQLYELFIKVNSSSLYPHLKGKLPTNIISLTKSNMDFNFAVTLLCNRVSYKEVVDNVLIENVFTIPKEWVMDIYGIESVYGEKNKNENILDFEF